MRVTRTASALTVGVAAALALTACAGGGDGAAPSTASGPVDGGELLFALAADPISLNPSGVGNGNITWYVTRQLVDSLLFQNPDTGELEPWLAESYESNDDATAFTFVLRDDVTFSDGTPLTAEDVKGTFDDIVAAGALSDAVRDLVGYEETVVVDDRTAEVRFSSPNAAFPTATTSVGLGIVGAATRETPYDERADGQAVVGTGAFTLESYSKDVETVLAAREDYAWAPEGLDNDGAAHLDSVVFQVVPEASVRLGSLVSGQLDAIGNVLPTDLEELDAQGLTALSRTNPGLPFNVAFNVASPLSADIAVREAVAASIDSVEVRDTLLGDLFPVATSSLTANTPGFADQSAFYAYDPEHAAEVLDGAGWTEGADGVRQKDGVPLQLSLLWATNNATNQSVVELIQQQLAEVGIGVELVSGTVPEVLARQDAGDFDLSWGNLSRTDGDVLRTVYSAATTRLGIDDPDLEALLQEQLAARDTTARADLLAQAQERIASQYYQVPVYELTSIIGLAPEVEGVRFGADSRLASLVSAWKDAR